MSGSRKVRSFTEDRCVIGSVVLILSGIVLGVLLAEPRAFVITALTVTGLQLILGLSPAVRCSHGYLSWAWSRACWNFAV